MIVDTGVRRGLFREDLYHRLAQVRQHFVRIMVQRAAHAAQPGLAFGVAGRCQVQRCQIRSAVVRQALQIGQEVCGLAVAGGEGSSVVIEPKPLPPLPAAPVPPTPKGVDPFVIRTGMGAFNREEILCRWR